MPLTTSPLRWWLLALSLSAPISTLAAALPDLKLGYQHLPQTVTSEKLEQGLVFHQVLRGVKSDQDYFTLSSGIASREGALELKASLERNGAEVRIETAAENDPYDQSLGAIVRVGHFQHKKDAQALQKTLAGHGINMAVRYTAEDGGQTTGPFQISLLEVDLQLYKGSLTSALGHDTTSKKELTSSMVKRFNAVAGVNAGFFAWKPSVGTPGDPAGIAIVDGKLLSEATDGRPVLLVQNQVPLQVRVLHNVSTPIALQLGKSKNLRVQGLNRKAGKVLNCGQANDPLLVRAAHDHVCQNPDEIIIYNQDFGPSIRATTGTLVMVRQGKISQVIPQPSNSDYSLKDIDFIVHFNGNSVKGLTLNIGDTASYSSELHSQKGKVSLTRGDYAFNGGPTLLIDGKLPMKMRAIEGWDVHYPEVKIDNRHVDKKGNAAVNNDPHSRAGFYHGWVVRRHPRTAAGITEDNKLYIAVVYGRQPGVTAGASVTEMALMLQALGAREGFNLDGGGSSMMVVNDNNTGLSSDKEGERAVGDALLILPPEK